LVVVYLSKSDGSDDRKLEKRNETMSSRCGPQRAELTLDH